MAIRTGVVPYHDLQSQQIQRRHRTWRRLGAVVVLLQPGDDRAILRPGIAVAAVLRIPKLFVHHGLQLPGPLEPADVERRFIKVEQALNQVRVILRKARHVSPAIAVGTIEHPGRLVVQLTLDELHRANGGFQIGTISQHLITLRQRGNHQTVPSGDDLVVELRTRSEGARLAQPKEAGLDAVAGCREIESELLRRVRQRPALSQNVPAAEFAVGIACARHVARKLHVEISAEEVRIDLETRRPRRVSRRRRHGRSIVQRLHNLLLRPDVECPLGVLAIADTHYRKPDGAAGVCLPTHRCFRTVFR